MLLHGSTNEPVSKILFYCLVRFASLAIQYVLIAHKSSQVECA